MTVLARNKICRVAIIGLLGAALLWLVFPAAAAVAQFEASRSRGAYFPMGSKLSSQAVRDELERRLAGNPGNEAVLWNAGYDFFRNYPKNQDTAQAIKNGFLSARSRNRNPQHRDVLLKAAIYWEKVHDYGFTNVPAGQNNETRQKIYYGDNSKASTLSMRKPGDRQHSGYPRHDWLGRYINKRPPYNGRPDNPYPGKYYPGRYPP